MQPYLSARAVHAAPVHQIVRVGRQLEQRGVAVSDGLHRLVGGEYRGGGDARGAAGKAGGRGGGGADGVRAAEGGGARGGAREAALGGGDERHV